jgi:hypothetical protein
LSINPAWINLTATIVADDVVPLVSSGRPSFDLSLMNIVSKPITALAPNDSLSLTAQLNYATTSGNI